MGIFQEGMEKSKDKFDAVCFEARLELMKKHGITSKDIEEGRWVIYQNYIEFGKVVYSAYKLVEAVEASVQVQVRGVVTYDMSPPDYAKSLKKKEIKFNFDSPKEENGRTGHPTQNKE